MRWRRGRAWRHECPPQVDPEDEIVRAGMGSLAKRRKGLNQRRQQLVPASASEVAEGSARKADGARFSLSRRRRDDDDNDHFGAQLGGQYRAKKGARGDVTKAGAPQPFAYLPLNPRMMHKKEKRKAGATAARLIGARKKADKGLGKRGTGRQPTKSKAGKRR